MKGNGLERVNWGRLADLLREAGAVPKFGLRQQGKYDRVTELRAAGKTWDEIGKDINWHGPTVQQFYELEK